MKTIKQQKNIAAARFAACANAARLLTISGGAAGRMPVSKSVSSVHLSAGRLFHGESSSGSQNNNINLTRCEIFRGKVPPRITQTKKHCLEIRTPLRQNYE
jgi:hypothetical protein